MRLTGSFRQSLLINVLTLLLTLAALIIASSLYATRRAVRALSDSLTAETVSAVRAEMAVFLQPVVNGLRFSASLGEQGDLDLASPERVNRLFKTFLLQVDQVAAVLVANDSGQEILFLRMPDGTWRNRETDPDRFGTASRITDLSRDFSQAESSVQELGYDPRTRPWFQGAIERRDAAAREGTSDEPNQLVHWTEPYTFFTTQEPGITASMCFDPGDGQIWVVAFDVLLSELSAFTSSISAGDNGLVLVMSEDGRVLGLPRSDQFADADARKAALLKRPEELGLRVAADATAAFDALGHERASVQAVRFHSEGRAWWGKLSRYQIGPDRPVGIAVLLPESDLLGPLQRLRIGAFVFLGVLLMLAVWRTMLLARRFGEPIEALAAHSDRLSKLHLDEPIGVKSDVREIKDLVAAQERMRESLRSLLKLEEDLRLARRIQQQTFPSELPTLAGFSIDAWSEPAEETGGDSYDIIGICNPSADGPVAVTQGESDRVIMLLADATGHGIGPALSATQVRAMLRMAVRLGIGIAEIASNMNEQLSADLHEGRFVTAWLGRLDAESGELLSFSAGQGPLLHYVAADDAFVEIPVNGPPLGIMPDLVCEPTPPIRLAPGDIVVVLSDGIYESVDAQGELFGDKGVEDIVRAHKAGSSTEIMTAIRERVEVFTGGAPARDDRTGIIIKRI